MGSRKLVSEVYRYLQYSFGFMATREVQVLSTSSTPSTSTVVVSYDSYVLILPVAKLSSVAVTPSSHS